MASPALWKGPSPPLGLRSSHVRHHAGLSGPPDPCATRDCHGAFCRAARGNARYPDKTVPAVGSGRLAWLAMAASHYSTTYVAITLIGLMLPLQWVVSWFCEMPRVTGAVAVAFVVALAGAFIWYGPVTSFQLWPGAARPYDRNAGVQRAPQPGARRKLAFRLPAGQHRAADLSGAVRATRPRLLRAAQARHHSAPYAGFRIRASQRAAPTPPVR